MIENKAKTLLPLEKGGREGFLDSDPMEPFRSILPIPVFFFCFYHDFSTPFNWIFASKGFLDLLPAISYNLHQGEHEIIKGVSGFKYPLKIVVSVKEDLLRSP